MYFSKKNVLTLVTLCLFLVTLVVGGLLLQSIHTRYTENALYEIEGQTKNALIYCEELEVTEGRVNFRLVNRTYEDVSFFSDAPQVYHWNEKQGEWEKVRIVIFDRDGMGNAYAGSIRAGDFAYGHFETTSLPAGVYRLQFQAENFSIVEHFTLIKN